MNNHDYKILIYSKENFDAYNAAIKALEATKKAGGWDRLYGGRILNDCMVPAMYHGNDFMILLERDNGSGEYSITVM